MSDPAGHFVRNSEKRRAIGFVVLLVSSVALGAPLREGDRVLEGGRAMTLTSFRTLPWVDDNYTRRFRFDRDDNPKLGVLRDRYRLEEVVASGKDEFDRQVLLMDWVHRQFTRFGRPSTNVQGALEILAAVEGGHTFFCKHYAEVLVSASASLGWVSRPLALRRHQGANRIDGSTEHSVIETWSNQHAKWVMFDPTAKLYVEKDGTPLNAFEIREEWFRHSGERLVWVVGKERRRFLKAEMPIVIGTYEGFGDLTVHRDEFDKYGFIGYVPNSDLMDAGYAYDRMFITQDDLCEGTRWHVRQVPKDPAVDPYFPVGQAALSLEPVEGGLRVELRTLTPNFRRYEGRIDCGDWRILEATWTWAVHAGENRLEARAINRFGIPGPVSSAQVVVE